MKKFLLIYFYKTKYFITLTLVVKNNLLTNTPGQIKFKECIFVKKIFLI